MAPDIKHSQRSGKGTTIKGKTHRQGMVAKARTTSASLRASKGKNDSKILGAFRFLTRKRFEELQEKRGQKLLELLEDVSAKADEIGDLSITRTQAMTATYDEKIADLSDRIALLELQLLEEQSLRALQIDTSAVPMHQVIPIQFYLSKDDSETAEEVETAIRQFLDTLGFDIVWEGEPVRESFWKKFKARSRERITPEELAETLAKLERFVGVRTHDLAQADVTLKQAEAFKHVMEAMRDRGDVHGQFGGLIVVTEGDQTLARTLTPKELTELETAPSRFTDAEEMRQLMQGDFHQLPGRDDSAEPPAEEAS